VVICYLERGANDLHMVQLMPMPPIISCFIKIENGSAFLVPAYLCCSGKPAIKQVLLYLIIYLEPDQHSINPHFSLESDESLKFEAEALINSMLFWLSIYN